MRNVLPPASASLALLVAVASSAVAQQSSRRIGQPPANVAGADWMAAAPQAFSVVLQVERSASPNNGNGNGGVNAQVVAAVCRSSAVADPALVAAFEMPIDQARPLAVIDVQPTSDAFLTLTVTLNDPQKKLPADAGGTLLKELASRATKAIAKSAELQVAPVRERRDELARRIADAQSQSDALDAQFAKAGPMLDANGNYNRNGAVDLQRQRNQLATQLAGLRARLAAIESQAARPPADATPPTSRPADAAVELLTRREAAVAKARAAGDEGAIAEAESRLAEARLLATLLDAIRQGSPAVRVSPGYVGFNGAAGTFDAGSLRVQIADLDAQVTTLDAQIAALGLPSTQPTMGPNDVNQLANDRNEARQRLRQARQELEQFDRQNGTIRAPRIVQLTGAE